ncbi:MAG: hypothetical protein E7Z91_01290 [Cyanobacteria bacterium SIG30]|nr:hypothetical protein [Cyanobacteria bacterium SIG30]
MFIKSDKNGTYEYKPNNARIAIYKTNMVNNPPISEKPKYKGAWKNLIMLAIKSPKKGILIRKPMNIDKNKLNT